MPEPPPAPPPKPFVVDVEEAKPPEPPKPLVESTGYPRAYVQRPLVLPQGVIEVSLQLGRLSTSFPNFSGDVAFEETLELYTGEGRVRYGFGPADIEAGGQLLLGEDVPEGVMLESQTFRSAFGALRYAVHPYFVIGGQVTYVNLSANIKRYEPRLVLATRKRFGERSAAEIAGLFGVDRETTELGARSDSANTYVVGLELRAQAQVSPRSAFEARANLAFAKAPEMESDFVPAEGGSELRQTYGLRFLSSIRPKVDLVFGADFLFSGEANTTQLLAGVVGRVP